MLYEGGEGGNGTLNFENFENGKVRQLISSKLDMSTDDSVK